MDKEMKEKKTEDSVVSNNDFNNMTISNDIEMLIVSRKLAEYQNKRIAELTAKE